MPDFVVTAAVTLRLFTLTMHLSKDLDNEAGESYDGNGRGIHMIYLIFSFFSEVL